MILFGLQVVFPISKEISYAFAFAFAWSEQGLKRRICTHLFESSVHYLQLFARELGVLAQCIKPLRLISHNLHLKIVKLIVCNEKNHKKSQSQIKSDELIDVEG